MGDPRIRHESIDIALPDTSRPTRKALPIPPQRETTVRFLSFSKSFIRFSC
jgi:hypothetical protein